MRFRKEMSIWLVRFVVCVTICIPIIHVVANEIAVSKEGDVVLLRKEGSWEIVVPSEETINQALEDRKHDIWSHPSVTRRLRGRTSEELSESEAENLLNIVRNRGINHFAEHTTKINEVVESMLEDNMEIEEEKKKGEGQKDIKISIADAHVEVPKVEQLDILMGSWGIYSLPNWKKNRIDGLEEELSDISDDIARIEKELNTFETYTITGNQKRSGDDGGSWGSSTGGSSWSTSTGGSSISAQAKRYKIRGSERRSLIAEKRELEARRPQIRNRQRELQSELLEEKRLRYARPDFFAEVAVLAMKPDEAISQARIWYETSDDNLVRHDGDAINDVMIWRHRNPETEYCFQTGEYADFWARINKITGIGYEIISHMDQRSQFANLTEKAIEIQNAKYKEKASNLLNKYERVAGYPMRKVTPEIVNESSQVTAIPILGGIEEDTLAIVQKGIETALKRSESSPDRHLVLLVIDTPGGGVEVTQRIITEFKRLGDDAKLIAYITSDEFGGAISAGAFIAFACHQIYMDPGAMIGGAQMVLGMRSAKEIYEKLGLAWEKFESINMARFRARPQRLGHPYLVMEAMVLEDMELWVKENGKTEFASGKTEESSDGETTEKNDENVSESSSEQEVSETSKSEPSEQFDDEWKKIKRQGEFLSLSASEMQHYEIAQIAGSSQSLGEKLGLESLHFEEETFYEWALENMEKRAYARARQDFLRGVNKTNIIFRAMGIRAVFLEAISANFTVEELSGFGNEIGEARKLLGDLLRLNDQFPGLAGDLGYDIQFLAQLYGNLEVAERALR